LAGQEGQPRALVDAKPDQTLAELRAALPKPSTHFLAIPWGNTGI